MHVDERAAGFLALGMAQHLRHPVALVCTSGTALINYGPAVAEAYYQQIPLMILSADRPPEWIDQADGQTMRQHNVFNNFIRKSVSLPVESSSKEDEWLIWRSLSETVRFCQYPVPGPVHINIPFREPLYEMETKTEHFPKFMDTVRSELSLNPASWTILEETLRQSKKIMMVAGLLPPEKVNLSLVKKLAEHTQMAILTDITSNIGGNKIYRASDDLIAAVPQIKNNEFQPDLLITFGGPVISKRLKLWLRKYPARQHWHITESFEAPDTFQSLNTVIPSEINLFLTQLESRLSDTDSNYQTLWSSTWESYTKKKEAYFETSSYSDLLACQIISDKMPDNSLLHLANSMPIRYGQFFQWPEGTQIYSNRGVSGIDGCISTAVGSAIVFDGFTTVITGDLSMLYDSHSLWNNPFPSKMRIIVFNNRGGSIFKMIDGPGKFPEYLKYFETSHALNLEALCNMHQIPYQSASDTDQLKEILASFYLDNGKPALLEVFTSQDSNVLAFKSYLQSFSN